MLKLNGKYINGFGTNVTITSFKVWDNNIHSYYGDNGGVFDKNGAILSDSDAKYNLKEYKASTQMDRIEQLLEMLVLAVEKFNDDYYQVNS